MEPSGSGHLLLGHQPLVDHEAREVRQAPGDAGLAAGLAADGPAHPLVDGGVQGGIQGLAGVELILDRVGDVGPMAAVEEGARRLQASPRRNIASRHACA